MLKTMNKIIIFLMQLSALGTLTNAANLTVSLSIQASDTFNGPIHMGIGMVCVF